MGIPSNEIRGLFNRTANLYNNRLFSDIEFRVRDKDGQVRVFYAHTLILATAGEKFARMYYENNRGPFETTSIVGFTPYVFDLMLKYIYTDKIKFATLDDAMNVFKLAKYYEISDLMVECDHYLSQFQVDQNSVLASYEYALVFEKQELVGRCRKLVSSNTKEIFESPYFCNASKSVIEDILKLSNLSLPTELDVIEAALQWCKAECKRKKQPTDSALYVREEFLPLCKNLRFLTLDITEFLDFEERNKIFTTKECISLTEKILDKTDPKIKIPTEFCYLRTPRCPYVAGTTGSKPGVETIDSKPGVETIDNTIFNFPAQSNGGSNLKQTGSNENQIFKYQAQSNSVSSVSQTKSIQAPLKGYYPHGLKIFEQSNSKLVSYPSQPNKPSQPQQNQKTSMRAPLEEISYPPGSQIFAQSNSAGNSNAPSVYYHAQSDGVHHLTLSNNVCQPAQSNGGTCYPSQSNGATNFRQTSPKNASPTNGPNYYAYKREVPQTSPKLNDDLSYEILPQKKNAPMLRVLPQTQQSNNSRSSMSYEFPLYEMQKEIGSCFENDVKCNAGIKMLRGIIHIHGIELRVIGLQKNAEEEIEVHLCLTNNDAQKSCSQKVQIKNNMLQLPFKDPIKVDPKNPLDIEVMIEELKLSRCGVCRSQQSRCELNCGLNVTAEIALKSNQSNGSDSFFFLISKLIYSMPKY